MTQHLEEYDIYIYVYTTASLANPCGHHQVVIQNT